MKTCYVDMDTRAIADLVSPHELTPWWTITRINVPFMQRGTGLGSKLLQEICEDADAEGVVLALEPQPSDGLDLKALTSWYLRYGFTESRHGYMIRRPLTKVAPN